MVQTNRPVRLPWPKPRAQRRGQVVGHADARRPFATLTAEHPLAAHLLHHFLHFAELFNQSIDIGNGRARALRDAHAARAIDQLGPGALLGRHRINNRFGALYLVY